MALRGRELLESEGLFVLKKCPGPGMCCVQGCRNRHHKGSAGLQLCSKHRQQRWRWKSPKRSAYATLRDHAKARKIPFSISPDYFMGMVDMLATWDLEAEKRGEEHTVDRIKAEHGYRPGNLQIITRSANAAKQARESRLPAVVQALIARKRAKAQEEAWKLHGEPDLEKDPF